MEKTAFNVEKTHTLVMQELRRLRREMGPFLVGERTDFTRHLNKARTYAVLAELALTTYRIVNRYRKFDGVAIASIKRSVGLLTGYPVGDELKEQFDSFDRGWRAKTLREFLSEE